MVQSETQRLELVAGLVAAADALRTSCAGFTAAAEVMRHCAKLADDWAETLKDPGAAVAAPSNGKRKAAADEDDEPISNGKRKRVAKKKDPNAPKRPASSYLLFQNEVRKDVKERFPTLSNTELLTVIKNQWGAIREREEEKVAQGLKESVGERRSIVAVVVVVDSSACAENYWYIRYLFTRDCKALVVRYPH
ncbi:hypothetical protein B0H19DRAFT_291684 [Mycena capillaripes]|nr:hypothetical protein B0H19DRAFT_291684 [Mycena capillaripes]